MIKSNSKSELNIDSNEVEGNSLLSFTFSNLSNYQEILHFVTTRKGGHSKPPFHTLNLAFHVGDKKENVLKNRKKLAQFFHISSQSFATSNQVHGTQVSVVSSKEKGSGVLDISTAIRNSDAMITDQKNICLLIFVADCVPIILYDCQKKVISLIHAGWKGTVGLITRKTVYRMQSHWGCKPENIIGAIGPSIGPCCYQVGSEVINRVKEIFPTEKELICTFSDEANKGYFNLWEANKLQLLNCQIPEKNIEVAHLCTYCHSDLFFSSRKEHGYTGRFSAGIMLKK